MNDRDDLTPPPDEPMPEQSRARIRADLLAATQDGGHSRASRWLVPGVAAAAVVLVAGMVAWAVQIGGDDGTSGSPAASTSNASSEERKDLKEEGAKASERGQQLAEMASCEEALVNVLPGAKRVVEFPEDRGSTTIWVKGDEFTLCDVRAGATTVHHPLPLTPAQDVETFRVSSLYAPAKDGFTVHRVAGGLVPEGAMAYDVSYTFPDGHTVAATTTKDDQGRTWWRMLTSYHEDSGVNETTLPPIEVTLSLSGVQDTFDLQWGIDTCAQANHGC
jgi:hypothetical protein